MTPAVEQLVRETVELTGAELPELLGEDAPVLADEALEEADDVGFYLVGIIGGKEVGKSALVNALVGQNITAITSHGPGTEGAIAYVHVSQEPALRELLEREVPGKYRIITHEAPELRRQVLLDLPDIDSYHESHLAVTRAMLRHMLFPVWVQSVEKYADRQPQQILAKVAEGNDAKNFLFCLNKADQLSAGDGQKVEPGTFTSEMEELRDDFAERVWRTLKLDEPPAVYLVSARHPDGFDLPGLRSLLAQQKEESVVRQGKVLAVRRQDRSLLDWLGRQDLVGQAGRLDRLRREAEEVTSERLGVPLVERVAPRLADDPSNRAALADDVLADRVAHWPLVNLMHTVLAPLFTLIRTMGAKSTLPLQGPEAMVDFHLTGEGAGGWSLAGAVRSAFGQLRQSHPELATLYPTRRLWEDLPAEQAASDLARRLSIVIEGQRLRIRDRLAGGHGVVAAGGRWLLTVGALLWFPIIQPVLQEWLTEPFGWAQWRLALKAVVQVLGANYLLQSAGFLVVYYAALWLALRWNTHRQVGRMLARWRTTEDPNPDLSLPGQVLQWIDDMAGPIRRAHERVADLAGRAEALRGELQQAA